MTFAYNVIYAQMKCVLPKGSDFEVVFTSIVFTEPYFLCKGPNNDLQVVSEGIAISINDSTAISYMLPITDGLTNAHWIDEDNLLLSCSNTIYYFSNDRRTLLPIAHIDEGEVVFKMGNKKLYYYEKGENYLYCLKFNDKSITPTEFVFGEEICSLAIDENDDCIIASMDKLYALIDDKELFPLEKSKYKINSIEIGNNGEIYYGTREGTYYLDSNFNKIRIIDKGANYLICHNDNLYIIFNDDSAGRITNISNYKNLLNEAKQKKQETNSQTNKPSKQQRKKRRR